jgi:hypothetical protein
MREPIVWHIEGNLKCNLDENGVRTAQHLQSQNMKLGGEFGKRRVG